MNEPVSNPSTWGRRFKLAAWCLLWLVTAIALLVAFENWRGRRAWDRFVAESKAAGEDLSPEAVIPPPVPDAENFAAVPLFKPLFEYEQPAAVDQPVKWKDEAGKDRLDKMEVFGPNPPKVGAWRAGTFTDLTAWQAHYRKLTNFPSAPQPQSPSADLLVALGKFDSELAQLREAAKRPHARFPVHYEDSFLTLLPHLSAIRNLGRLTQLRAVAELSDNKSAEAAEDTLLTLRFAEAVESEPLLISQLVRVAVLEQAMTPLWEGLARHQWTDAQLAAFEQRLSAINFAASHQLALRGERTLGTIRGMDRLREQPELFSTITGSADGGVRVPVRVRRFSVPSAFIDQSKVVASSFLNEAIRGVDPVGRRFDNHKPDEIEARLVELRKHFWLHPYSIMAAMLLPAVSRTTERSATMQSTVDLARVAIALERHRLKHGSLPATLDALDAALKPAGGLPRDVITGEPLRYKPSADGRFQLYATGWNGTDDGGEVVWFDKKKQTRIDFTKGDLVWPMPAK